MSVFSVDEEVSELRDTVRSLLTRSSDTTRVRQVMAEAVPFDKPLWRRLSEELGVAGLLVPEEYGGAGFSFAGCAAVLEELGRSLACVPFLASSVLAVSALLEAGTDEARAAYLPGLADGSVIGTLALLEPGTSSWAPGDVALALDEAGPTLTGVKRLVLDGGEAGLILAAVRTSTGLALVAVDTSDPSVTVTPDVVLDQTRGFATVGFDSTPVVVVSSGDVEAALARVIELGSTALAVESIGGAQRCLEMSVEYAKTRYQFGRPIGSYQAISHKCADMLADVELSRSTAAYVVWATDHADFEERSIAAETAAAQCSDAYLRVAGDTIQIHGGIGFTWEHDAHLYFKRAKAAELLFGDAIDHRRRLADLIKL